MEKIFKPTVAAMAAEGRTFVGILYFGLMLTKDGMKVIEYNARFGDPETQVILPRLKTDMLEIMEACVDTTLDKMNIEWYDNAAVCVVEASGGYPVSYEKGFEITGLDEVAKRDGGRVLGITGIGKDLDEARKIAYEGVDIVNFEKKHFRHDIGIKKY